MKQRETERLRKTVSLGREREEKMKDINIEKRKKKETEREGQGERGIERETQKEREKLKDINIEALESVVGVVQKELILAEYRERERKNKIKSQSCTKRDIG